MLKLVTPDFQPLVTIVVPVFNGANYMREAIDSALAQTYSNVEIVVVNDGSRDEGQTDAIARSYGDKIRYFSKENGGCASALNLGIANMRGEYFSWLSHDDRYMSEKIAHQVKLLTDLIDRNTIIYGGYEVINQASAFQYTVRPDSVLPTDKLNIPLLPLLRGLIHGCSLLIPKKYFNEVGVFDVNLPSTQDYALWFDIFRVAPLHFDPEILIQSRVHPDQGTHKFDKHIDDCNTLWCGFLQKLTVSEMSEMEDSPLNFLNNTAQLLAKTPYKEAHQLAVKMIQECQTGTKISVVIPFYNRVDGTYRLSRGAGILRPLSKKDTLLVMSILSAFIELKNASVAFPVHNAVRQSIKNRVLSAVTGGKIYRKYDGSVVVKGLDCISLKIVPGERVGLVGHNGSGKTTQLRVLSGIYQPTYGQANFVGECVSLINISLGVDPEANGRGNIRLRAVMMGMQPQTNQSEHRKYYRLHRSWRLHRYAISHLLYRHATSLGLCSINGRKSSNSGHGRVALYWR